jgi:tRNA-modifying protein YgfZ
MNTNWIEFLKTAGAVLEGSTICHFGNPAAERQAAASGSIVADLSYLGVLAFAGEDAQSFLQGQLTNDLRPLTRDQNQYSGYCNPKGRLLASFLVWGEQGNYFLQLPAALLPTIQKRLSMFILRAKVKAIDASDASIRLGVQGAAAAEVLRQWWPQLPGVHATAHSRHGLLLGLPGDRYELLTDPALAPELWRALTQVAQPAGAETWTWLEIMNGIPIILPATQEAFVPQMVNFDAIQAVNFKKGCYPGQEIVARSQYLGTLKRRMYHLQGDGQPPAAGEDVYNAQDQAVGTIVNAAPASAGGFDALAVLMIESKQAPLHTAGSASTLRLAELPYATAS